MSDSYSGVAVLVRWFFRYRYIFQVSLRCYVGSAPVTKQSGKRRMVSMRRACSDRVRQALIHWSGRSIMVDSRSRQHQDRLRASGHSPRESVARSGRSSACSAYSNLAIRKPNDARLRDVKTLTDFGPRPPAPVGGTTRSCGGGRHHARSSGRFK